MSETSIKTQQQPPLHVNSEADEKLLKEIRHDFRAFLDYWRENRQQMEEDMRFAGGDAFTAAEHTQREADDRPCETPDELSQYVKQTANSMRQNKRDSKISAASEDATDEDAEKRESLLRGLNHRGNFQAVFQTAYEACTWCGFGAMGIQLKYTDKSKKHVEPRPRRLANQFSVIIDPYFKEADASDLKKAFIVERMRIDDFVREYPNAQKRSFSPEDARIAPDFIEGDELLVAEAWRVEEDGRVMQYHTNGLEILERDKWEGSWIPVIPILGEEIYVTENGRQKRRYLSLIRRARTPQKMLAYIASQELEEFGQAPRTPFVGYKGQFTDPNWETINRKPRAFIEVEPMPDPLNPSQVLPLPSRPQYQPNAAAYDMAREAWRRAVQAAIGITPLPTAAQRQNEKSGVALEKIQNQEAVGSYHFVDNADRALVNYGRQMNELITKVMTTPRHVSVRKQDGKDALLRLSTAQHGMPEGEETEENVLFVDRGEFDVAVTTGPSKESEREEAGDFVDMLLENLQNLPIPQPIQTKILSIAIRLKNVGPLGDEIAKLLDPEEGDPMAQAQKLMGQAQQQQQAMQELQAELQQLRLEKQGKVIDNQFKLQLQEMKDESQRQLTQLAGDMKILGDLILARRAEEDQEQQMFKTFWQENHQSAVAAGSQAADHAHELALSQQEHDQALQQGQQAAALAPQPDQQVSAGPAQGQ